MGWGRFLHITRRAPIHSQQSRAPHTGGKASGEETGPSCHSPSPLPLDQPLLPDPDDGVFTALTFAPRPPAPATTSGPQCAPAFPSLSGATCKWSGDDECMPWRGHGGLPRESQLIIRAGSPSLSKLRSRSEAEPMKALKVDKRS